MNTNPKMSTKKKPAQKKASKPKAAKPEQAQPTAADISQKGVTGYAVTIGNRLAALNAEGILQTTGKKGTLFPSYARARGAVASFLEIQNEGVLGFQIFAKEETAIIPLETQGREARRELTALAICATVLGRMKRRNKEQETAFKLASELTA